MTADTILTLVVFIAGFIFLYSSFNRKSKGDETLTKWLASMQENMLKNNKDITDTLQSNTRFINERLDRAATVIGALQKEAGAFSEVSRSMKSLQEFLQSPKLRGNIGEHVLNDLISQVFPKNSFHLQYQFKSGEKVDAVLQTDAGILCIDSKFPMENFQRMVKGETEDIRNTAKKDFIKDVKKHIDAISQKYILPEEGTMDFALMYIPSEPVYYEIVNLNELTEYAKNKRVYPVSPTTLYAHLQVLLLSFQGKKIEQKTKEVFSLLRALQKDYEKTQDNLSVLGKHVTNSFNSLSTVASSFAVMGQKLSSTKNLSIEEETNVN